MQAPNQSPRWALKEAVARRRRISRQAKGSWAEGPQIGLTMGCMVGDLDGGELGCVKGCEEGITEG